MSMHVSLRVESGLRLVFLWLVVFPVICVIVSAVFAGPLVAAEDATFEEAFLFLVAAVTATGIPLTTWAGPTGTGGQVLTVLVGIIALMILAVHIGVCAGPLLEPFLEEPTMLVSRTKMQMLQNVTFFFLVTFPVLAIGFSAVFGALLAAAEGWPYADGFVMALGEVTATKITNPGTPPPDTTAGKVVGLYVGVFAASLFGLTVAIAGVPLLGFDLAFNSSPVPQLAPYLFLNSEQREDLDMPKYSAKGKINSTELINIGAIPPAAY